MFDHNPDYGKESLDGILFENCSGCTFSGFQFADTKAGNVVELRNCGEISMTGCQIINPENIGVLLENSYNCRVSNCTILDKRSPQTMKRAIKVIGGSNNVIANNIIKDK